MLAFHLTHVHIIDTNQCGEFRRTAFKRCKLFQDFYVVVIMLRGQLHAFIIKYNQNTMVEIDPFL